MFGHNAEPDTKNYRYGALEPIEGLDRVWEQLKLAHRYRNAHIELELRRRTLVNDVMRRMAPDVERLEKEVEAADALVIETLTEIKAVNKASRKKVEAKDARLRLVEARARLRELRIQLREARSDAKASPDISSAIDVVNQETSDGAKKARAESGLYWGTYLSIEQAVQGSKRGPSPRFFRWDGNGKLSVQIQNGMSLDALFGGSDTRIQIDPVPENAWDRGQPKNTRYTTCRFRVGSDGRAPVWAVIPMQLHRPLPVGARVKWAHLLARRVGTKTRWYLVLTISHAPDLRPVSDHGEVQVDIGWKIVDGAMQVATWRGDDGEEGRLLIPHQELGRWTKAEDLRSIRDKRFEVARSALKEWLATAADRPAWLTEATATIAQWRSAARIAALAIRWREERFAGDSLIFDHVELWRQKDKHLLEWEANQRRKSVAWRDDLYHCFAANLAIRYRVCRLRDLDWKKMALLPGPEAVDPLHAAARGNRVIASPGRLEEILCDRFEECVVGQVAGEEQGQRASLRAAR